MKKTILTLTIMILTISLLFVCGCRETESVNKDNIQVTASPDKNGNTPTQEPENEPDVEADEYFSKFDKNTAFSMEDAVQIDVSKGSVNITTEGTYILSGTLSDGQIKVSVDKLQKVRLVLNNVSVTNSKGSAIYVETADKVLLYMPEGTVNTFTDSAASGNDTERACIYSKEDLSINGSGKLIVNGNYNNGIATKNDLRISGGEIVVTAVNNAIKGNDSVAIRGGSITVVACEDAIKSDSVDLNEGYIYISGGTFDINASDDGLQASQDITVTGGEFKMACEGKKVNSKGTSNVGSFLS